MVVCTLPVSHLRTVAENLEMVYTGTCDGSIDRDIEEEEEENMVLRGSW